MIVVTGMHRSGTSSIVNLLMELGIPCGDPAGFLPADRWNVGGYFEQADALDLNCRVVTGFSYTRGRLRRLLSQAVYATQPGPATLRRRFRRLEPEVRALGAKYAGQAVKDPRFCLTLGLWREVVQVQACVVCLRHPLAAAGSLERRQRFPQRLGLRFWDYHVAALLEALPGLRTLSVDYEALLGPDPDPQLQAIGAFFALDQDLDALREVHGRVLRSELRHLDPAPAPLPPRTRALWERLRAL